MPVEVPRVSGLWTAVSHTQAQSGLALAAGTTANTKGAWTEVTPSLARDAYAVMIVGGINGGEGVNSAALLDLGVGAAGAEVVLLPNLMVGNADAGSATALRQSRSAWVPLYIPAGSRVAVRAQCATGGRTGIVQVYFLHAPLYPFIPGLWLDYGTNLTTSSGVDFAINKADPSQRPWALVGTLSRDHDVLLCLVQFAGTLAAATNVYVEFAIGDGTNFTVIHRFRCLLNTSVIMYLDTPAAMPIFGRFRAGAGVYVRGGTSGANQILSAAIYGG